MVPKKILFCTDFSENSEPARELAVDYAKAFGAQLIIVHVIDSNSFPDYVDWVGEEHSADWTDEALKQILKRTQEHAKDRLESLESECAKGVEQVKTWCRIGLPSKEIAALAARRIGRSYCDGDARAHGSQALGHGKHRTERSQNGSSPCADRRGPARRRGIILRAL